MRLSTKQKLQKILGEQKASGLSVPQFCQQNNINIKSFYNSRKALGETKPSTHFVKVKTATKSEPPLILQAGNSVLHLPSSSDPVWLATLLKALAS